MEAILADYTPCDILNEFSLDYIVLPSAVDIKDMPWLESYLEQVWQGREGWYRLFKLDQEAAKEHFGHIEALNLPLGGARVTIILPRRPELTPHGVDR